MSIVKTYFVTGITGTLGKAVLKLLLERPNTRVIGYSRDELKQSQIPTDERLTLYLGDLRDRSRLVEATRGVDEIMHFGSLKRVDTLEDNPEEAFKTIIEGTSNVLHAQRIHGIKRVTMSSTDKAVYPVNTYGACKLVAERLVLRNKNNVVCRYGNVLGSRGSVVHMFVKSILKNNLAQVTDKEMTRFFIPIEGAAKFVFSESHSLEGGLKVPKMKACTIVDLAESVARILKKDIFISEIGIRAGEKLHEMLHTFEEKGDALALYRSDMGEKFAPHELDDMVRPLVEECLK